MLKQTLSTLLCAAALLPAIAVNAQTADGKKSIATKEAPKASITFSLTKMSGIGPSGHTSTGIGTYDPYDNEGEYKAYPKVKNKPMGLQSAVHYFYMLNNFQFFYQNYCEGKYSKEFFLENVEKHKWRIEDTVKLSRKPIKCGISVMAGFNKANDLVYVVDANNNGDYGDDVLKPVLVQAYGADIAAATPVYTEYVAGKDIKNENIRVMISNYPGNTDKSKVQLMFSFPEFRYAKFDYQGQPYFIVSEVQSLGSNILIVPDVPNFTSAPRGSEVRKGQFVQIGDGEFEFSASVENGNKITLTGADISGFSSKPVTPPKAATKPGTSSNLKSTFSTQLGFMAPIIKGVNINPLAKDVTALSTADMKGKYVFVDFWSSYCGPCIAEFPNLKAAYDRYDRTKFEIVGVLDERDQEVTKRLIGEGNMIWPTIISDVKGTETKGYNVNSYPTSYLIDPQGKIVAMNLRGEDLMNRLKTYIK